MFWSPHKKVSFDLQGLDTSILGKEELTGLDKHFENSEIKIHRSGADFSLYLVNTSLFGPKIGLYGSKDIAYEVSSAFADGVAKIVKGKVEEGRPLGDKSQVPLKVIDLQTPKERLRDPPFPLRTLATYLDGFKGLGEIQTAQATYVNVPRTDFNNAQTALGEKLSAKLYVNR